MYIKRTNGVCYLKQEIASRSKAPFGSRIRSTFSRHIEGRPKDHLRSRQIRLDNSSPILSQLIGMRAIRASDKKENLIFFSVLLN